MKPCILILAISFAFACNNTPAKGRVDYLLPADSNETNLVPPYGLIHVQSLIAGIHQDTSGDSDFDDQYMALDSVTYFNLPLREKFTYNMIQNEAHYQNCDIIPEHIDEAHRIYGALKTIGDDEDGWSDRQGNFFKNNRDSVMVLIRECIRDQHIIGNNTMDVIHLIGGTEIIPLLVESYKNEQAPKDHYILTLMLLLMEGGKYPEMLNSETHRKLYGNHAKAGAYLVYNQANEDLIIKRAMDYYNGLAKK